MVTKIWWLLHASISDFETTLQLRTALYRNLRNCLISTSVKNRKKCSVHVDQTRYSPVFYLADQGLSQISLCSNYDCYTNIGTYSSDLEILLTVHLSIIYSLFPTWYTVFLFTYNNCCLLSSKCFRPHRPIIRRSKLYKQPMVFSNGRTTKTSAEGENTIGCMYNLDLLMMGLWGLKHVEERG